MIQYYWCLDCDQLGELDKHGRCQRCASESVVFHEAQTPEVFEPESCYDYMGAGVRR